MRWSRVIPIEACMNRMHRSQMCDTNSFSPIIQHSIGNSAVDKGLMYESNLNTISMTGWTQSRQILSQKSEMPYFITLHDGRLENVSRCASQQLTWMRLLGHTVIIHNLFSMAHLVSVPHGSCYLFSSERWKWKGGSPRFFLIFCTDRQPCNTCRIQHCHPTGIIVTLEAPFIQELRSSFYSICCNYRYRHKGACCTAWCLARYLSPYLQISFAPVLD